MAQLEQERAAGAGGEAKRITHWIGGRAVAGTSGRSGKVPGGKADRLPRRRAAGFMPAADFAIIPRSAKRARSSVG